MATQEENQNKLNFCLTVVTYKCTEYDTKESGGDLCRMLQKVVGYGGLAILFEDSASRWQGNDT